MAPTSCLEQFKPHRIDVGRAEIFARIGGAGPPLLLLHGFPQTHVCWTRIAPQLAEHFTLILADLTGYGESKGPAPGEDGVNYSKRAVAADMAELMKRLGHDRFRVGGHDRGARVAYRLALDHLARVERVAALSILPTSAMWRRLGDVSKAINTYHWFLLAQKPPIPHDLLAGAPGKQVRNTLASWTATQSLEAFTAGELQAYEAAMAQPDAIAAICAEYRAAWMIDRDIDDADIAAGRKIACPLLALWGLDEYTETEMRAAWREIAANVEMKPLNCGHFVTEEAPGQTADDLTGFFA